MRRWILVVGAGSWLMTTPVAAQVGGNLTLQSDDRFRGRSFSDGRPVMVGSLSYDHRSGLYAGGSATAILTGERRAGLSGARAYGGYAVRTASGASFDLGVVGYRYTSRFSGGREVGYVEGYAGVFKDGLSGHIRFSPNYFDRGAPVVYVDVAATRALPLDWRLNSSLGLLVQTSGAPILGDRRSRYDAKIGVSREFGKIQLSADVTFAGPDGAYYDGPFSGRSALVLSASRSF